MSFQKVPFLDIFKDASGGNIKTPQNEFLGEGSVPVVDQGQRLIAGFVNERGRVCKATPPVIVFGDHTRAIKYVDFEFAMGADGIKVLVPRIEADTKFLFYALRATKLPDAGYSRYFKFLKKTKIPLPPLSYQKRIAGILDAADVLRTKRGEALAQLDTLLQSTFLDMFGDPVTNPMGWKVVRGDNVFSDLTYGTSRKASEVRSANAIPVLRIPNIVGGQVDWTDLKFVEPTPRERQAIGLKLNDLLFVRTNGNPNYIGRCARFDGSREALFASYLIRGRVSESVELESEFLKHVVEYPTYRHEVRREARTTAGNFNLSTTGIRKFEFIEPPLDLQRRFTAIVNAVERQKARMRAHLAELDILFASLQSRAFNGEL